MTMNATTIHAVIERASEEIYAFVADPRNMPKWAPNFGHAIALSGEHWIMETRDGPCEVRFAKPNQLGVLDHWVITPDGKEFYNPMRVIENGDASLISFTLFQQTLWTEERLASDAALVEADLQRLKGLVESGTD